VPRTVEEFTQQYRADLARWKDVVKNDKSVKN